MSSPPYNPPPDGPAHIYADDWLIVVDKPTGLLSVPGRGPDKADCARSRVQEIWPDALTVHRLDMATSGLLLFARSKDVQRALSRLFEQGAVEKTYLADIWGSPDREAGLIDLPLITDWPNRPRQKVDHESGKPSQTRYDVLARHAATSRVRLVPLTGRSHQLRVHMAECGHAILGDDLYAPLAARRHVRRLHLHAASLTFTHPYTGDRMVFQSPCPFQTP
ncbi:pseudouridine synthase [Hyphomonas sp.]|uniref:pseudouridine synthase n=1 Tax=Hyphomonas sp. TaxID=87 RepID=UPI0025BEA9C8|nr:pseudouridine synthase [Hyphomonas sp.]